MRFDLMSAVFVVLLFVVLLDGLPVQQSEQLNTFLAKVNGTVCLTQEELLELLGTPYYRMCFNVCVDTPEEDGNGDRDGDRDEDRDGDKDGDRACYQRCT